MHSFVELIKSFLTRYCILESEFICEIMAPGCDVPTQLSLAHLSFTTSTPRFKVSILRSCTLGFLFHIVVKGVSLVLVKGFLQMSVVISLLKDSHHHSSYCICTVFFTIVFVIEIVFHCIMCSFCNIVCYFISFLVKSGSIVSK